MIVPAMDYVEHENFVQDLDEYFSSQNAVQYI
jgi:hypothetical protein